MLNVPERLESGKWCHPWVRYQHERRFEFVSRLVQGLTVADVACGDGAGALVMVQRGAARVDAFDLSLAAVLAARQRFTENSGLCCVADAASLPVRDATYDIVVSLETIEHLVDDRAFLDEVIRVVKPGGTFICSTPNRDLLDPGTSISDQPFNKFHVREYSLEEFKALLAPRFSSVEWLGQSLYPQRYLKALASLARLRPKAAVRVHQVRKLITSLVDHPTRHEPKDVPEGWQPEILLALCRR